MPIYDLYPYTNLHELNLNEIIRTMDEFKSELERLNVQVGELNDIFSRHPVTGQLRINESVQILGTVQADSFIGPISGTVESANALNCGDVGANNNPVYFDDGVPVPTSATLNKSISGNAATATKLQNAFTLNLLGDVTGTVLMDGGGTANIQTTIVGTTPSSISTIPNDLTVQGDLTVTGDIHGGDVYGDTFQGPALSLVGLTPTIAELNYVDGVSSNIQTQLNAKQATITGAASSVVSDNLTARRVLVSDLSGKIADSTITAANMSSCVEAYTNGLLQKKILYGTEDVSQVYGEVGDVYIKYSV